MGGPMAAAESAGALWRRIALIALGFFVVLALVLVIALVMHR